MIVEPKREILLGPLVRAGVQRSWAARDHFLRLGVIPAAAMVAILVPLQTALIKALTSAQAAKIPPDNGDFPLIAVLTIAYVVVLAVFAVNWLRQLTLGTSAVPGVGLSLSRRHLRFFFFMIAISFANGLSALILVFMLSPFGLAGAGAAIIVSVLVWAVVLARISPSWIGIALDARMPLRVAWRRTSGQGFKLLVALLAIDVPLMFVRQLVEAVFASTGLVTAAPLTFTLITVVIQLMGMAAQLAVLVTAFPHFLRETV
jgi:hypothetical protein